MEARVKELEGALEDAFEVVLNGECFKAAWEALAKSGIENVSIKELCASFYFLGSLNSELEDIVKDGIVQVAVK